MNPPLNFTQAGNELSILTSQTANFTFDQDELTQALTFAWQDSFVGNIVFDSSLTYTQGTWQYPVPTTMTTVRDIYIIKPETQLLGAGGNYPEKINSDFWEVVNGNIQFTQITQNFIYDTVTLYIKGFYKLTISDSLQTDNLINYVLSLAAYRLLRQLLLKRSFVFLRNDITSQEIKLASDEMQSDMLSYKQKLLREFESA